MRIAILSKGSIVVREDGQEWLFGAPAGIGMTLKESGIATPKFLFLTSMRAPGCGSFPEGIAVIKEEPLCIGNTKASPVKRKHGTDYSVESDGAKVLFSERGDVSCKDVEGYDLAVIRNKHRADGFGPNVITWPWPDTEYDIVAHELSPVNAEIALKIWGSAEDVPNNLKNLDGASLTLEQSNYIAKVAIGSGKETGGGENWAIGISTFKKTHHKDGDHWVENDKTAEKEMETYEPVGEAFSVVGNESEKEELKNSDGLTADDFLVVEDPDLVSTWHLPIAQTHGKPDADLMGAAHAALTVGYRGNKYEGPDKEKALAKLRKLYNKEKQDWPEESAKEWEEEELKDFKGHRGRPGKQGGSLPEEQGDSSVTEYRPFEVGDYVGDRGDLVHEDANGSYLIGRRDARSFGYALPKGSSRPHVKYFDDDNDLGKAKTWVESKKREFAKKASQTNIKRGWSNKEWTNAGPTQRIGDILVAAMHREFTVEADNLYAMGCFDEKERIQLSGAISKALQAFRDTADEEVLNRPYGNIVRGSPLSLPSALKEMVPEAPDQIDGSWSTVYKDAEGNDRWATITAASMWDRQREFIPVTAMDWALSFSKVVGQGPLRYKHFPGLDGGDCDRQVRVGDFLFESGTFRSDPIGLAMKNLMRNDPNWQVSPGMLYGKEDLQSGVYKRFWLFERSLTKVPAIPATATISMKDDGGIQMKQLTETELKQVASDLQLDPEYVRELHRRALAGAGENLGLKEFKELVVKESKKNEPDEEDVEDLEDQSADEETEGEPEEEEEPKGKLKELVDELDQDQRLELMEALGVGYLQGETTKSHDEEIAELREGIETLKEMVTNLARQDPGEVLKEYFQTTPRRQAQFAVDKRGTKESPTDVDAQIMRTLNSIEEQLKDRGPGGGGLGNVYDLFTSQALNRSDSKEAR